MVYFSWYKTLTIFFILLLSLYFSLPNFFYQRVDNYNSFIQEKERGVVSNKSLNDNFFWPSWLSNKILNLGLDLRGGAHLLVEVDSEKLFSQKINSIWPQLRNKLREKVELFGNIKKIYNDDGLLVISIEKKENLNLALNELKSINENIKSINTSNAKKYEIYIEDDLIFLDFSNEEKNNLKRSILNSTLEIIRNRVDKAGTREPSIQRQGTSRILVQVPGVGSAEEIINLIGTTAKLSFHEVFEVSEKNISPSFDNIVLKGLNNNFFYEIGSIPVVSGEDLNKANGTKDEFNRPAVAFTFNPIAGKKFGDYTRANIGRLFAIVIDEKVISAPQIQSYIPGGSGIITGNFSIEESNQLAIMLSAGALPADIKILEQRTVGPELGADSISAGKFAILIGSILVVFFMIFIYRFFGFFANLALVFNIFLIISIMSIIGATLTLPGIAGIVLTIGMAVDANVLIFERIKEEYKVNNNTIISIEKGYKRAITSIIDANVTTMIAAIILYVFGSGPIKGFSVTLGIGIITSVFSAIFFTRLLIILMLQTNLGKKIKF